MVTFLSGLLPFYIQVVFSNCRVIPDWLSPSYALPLVGVDIRKVLDPLRDKVLSKHGSRLTHSIRVSKLWVFWSGPKEVPKSSMWVPQKRVVGRDNGDNIWQGFSSTAPGDQRFVTVLAFVQDSLWRICRCMMSWAIFVPYPRWNSTFNRFTCQTLVRTCLKNDGRCLCC